MKPKRGDLVRVDWLDICEDGTGDPAMARLARRITFGIFIEIRDDDGVRVLVTTTTAASENGDTYDSGWCIYPMSCVTRLRVMRKGAAKV